MGHRRAWIAGALVALTALAGCRGCGCDDEPAAAGDASRPVDASVDVSPAQTMGPDAVERSMTEGLRAIAKGDRRTAIARFEAAAQADPGRRVPQQRLCGLYRDAGRTGDALRACSAWRELEPEPDFRARADAIIEALRTQRDADRRDGPTDGEKGSGGAP